MSTELRWRGALKLILLPGSRPSCHECICPPENWGMHTDPVSSTKPFRCHSHSLLFPGLTMMTNRENAVCQHWQGSVCPGTGLWLYSYEVCVLFFLKLAGVSYPRNQSGLSVTFPLWFWEAVHWSVVFPKEQNKVYNQSLLHSSFLSGLVQLSGSFVDSWFLFSPVSLNEMRGFNWICINV